MSAKVVLLSGANRGIGFAIANALYESGYLLSLGSRDVSALHAKFNKHEKERLLLTHYDAQKPETGVEWVANTIQHFGKINALINCAGIFLDCDIENFQAENLDTLLNINTKAPILLTEAAWPYLKQTGDGRVINIVSLAGKFAQGGNFGYSVSKHALLAFTHAIRQAGWQYGIRATALCPNWVNTDMAKMSTQKPENMTQPKEIATLVETLLTLPNNASIAELSINCECYNLF